MKTQLDHLTKYNKLLIKKTWLKTGKAAAIGAAVVGGTYLAYRGIKALFENKT